MKFIRVAVNGAILTLGNIAAVLAGFGLYTLVRPADQIAFQAPVAAALSVLGFMGWDWMVRRAARGRWLRLDGLRDYAWVYLLSLLWNPLLFAPLHFIGTGYLTSFDNIMALWIFQLPVNLLAVWAGYNLVGGGRELVSEARYASAQGDCRGCPCRLRPAMFWKTERSREKDVLKCLRA